MDDAPPQAQPQGGTDSDRPRPHPFALIYARIVLSVEATTAFAMLATGWLHIDSVWLAHVAPRSWEPYLATIQDQLLMILFLSALAAFFAAVGLEGTAAPKLTGWCYLASLFMIVPCLWPPLGQA